MKSISRCCFGVVAAAAVLAHSLVFLGFCCYGPTAVAAASEGSKLAEGSAKYVLVAGPPRMGTTWLFNAVRVLVRYHDPNVISGFETSFAARDVCYWRSRDVSMVVKTHALHKDFMVGAQCTDGTFLPGFDLAVTSFRDPFETGCSLVKKDGRVAASTCEKILCEQHAFYHPPTVKLVADGHGDNEAAAVSRRPEMVYEMDFRDLTSGLRLDILRDLAEALGLTQSLARAGAALLNPESAAEGVSQGDALEAVLRAVARELKLLRPLGDPIHSLRSAQHPVSLMHANHVGRAGANAQALCDADAGLNAMRKNPVCHALAENHGRVSDALWDAYPSWQGRCARLKKIPTPLTKEELVAKTAAESQQKRQKQKQRQQQQQQQQKREL